MCVGCQGTVQHNDVRHQTTVGSGDETFSLQSTGRTVRSLSAGSNHYSVFCTLILFVLSSAVETPFNTVHSLV